MVVAGINDSVADIPLQNVGSWCRPQSFSSSYRILLSCKLDIHSSSLFIVPLAKCCSLLSHYICSWYHHPEDKVRLHHATISPNTANEHKCMTKLPI